MEKSMTIFYGTSKELRFAPNNQKAWLDFLEQNDGKKLVVDIELEKSKRTLDQNALYWLYLDVIANETGNISEYLHQLFKGLFLPKRFITIKGKTYTMSGSTKGLSKTGFSLYMDKICAFTGVPIPDDKLSANKVEYPENNLGQTPF
jgi:hypothetical protein